MVRSAAFIETPLMDFFSGKFDVVAAGVGLFQYGDTHRFARGRILLDSAISSDFSIDVKVKEAEVNQNPTSSAATHIGLSSLTVLVFFCFGIACCSCRSALSSLSDRLQPVGLKACFSCVIDGRALA